MSELERVIEWLEKTRAGNKAVQAAISEIRRLQTIEAAAREVLNSFMVTDVWDDKAATPAREEAVGDTARDQRLEKLAAALDAKP